MQFIYTLQFYKQLFNLSSMIACIFQDVYKIDSYETLSWNFAILVLMTDTDINWLIQGEYQKFTLKVMEKSEKRTNGANIPVICKLCLHLSTLAEVSPNIWLMADTFWSYNWI